MKARQQATPPIGVVNWMTDVYMFEHFFDASPVAMVITSLTRDRVLVANVRAAEVLHVTKDDLVGGRVTDYYAEPTEREGIITGIARSGRADDLELRLRRPDGSPLWAAASARRMIWQDEPAILTAFIDITRQTVAEQAVALNEQRLAAQIDALTALTDRSTEGPEPADDRMPDILRVAAETLGAERVSVWRLDDNHQEIRCESLFLRSSGRYDCGMRIARDLWPAYFNALDTERVIAAHDAHRDPRTRGFLESYLVPHGIGAMLDVPLRQNHGTLGVLCAEHVGGPRSWRLDEQNFALSVANLIAIAVVDEERRQALARLAESEARANLIVDTAHDAFIGIDTRGRIVTWNAQAALTFGWSRSEVLGRNLADTIIPPSYRAAHVAGMRRFYATGEAPIVNRRLELTALHRSGREFPIELTITSPVPGDKGFFFGAFLRDISDRREHEEQLGRAKAAAERSRDQLQSELASAGRMQQLLLPAALPSQAGLQFATHYRTSRHAGGDYYDVLRLGDNRFAVVVADVSGHGASAAIVMAMIRAALHSCGLSGGPSLTPGAVLQFLNDHFRYLWSTPMFATAVVAILDLEQRTLCVSSAGHPAPLLVRDGQVSELPVVNAPLLFWEELGDIPCHMQTLCARDRVVFYTDGITERRAPDDTFFDLPRMMRVVAEGSRLELTKMTDQLVRALDTFAGDTEPDDDQTLLAIGIE